MSFNPNRALPTARSLSPGFLIASPKLDGSPFERAVVVIVHHDEEGAMGFIINKPLEIDFGSLIQSVNEDIARKVVPNSFDVHVYFGGPVRIEQLWLIFQEHLAPGAGYTTRHSKQFLKSLEDNSTLAFAEGWFLAASGDVIEGFALGLQEGNYRPFIGYSGWGPGQLEAEIEDGSWLILDFEEDLFFDSIPAYNWDQALNRLGVDPTAFLMMGKSGIA
ncbi:MAG: YqgE/AlgH family protein [Bradymonadaceae bacterium]|nr:YqgE/AlgH family protein [Lujinxingiaceae bacterium]